MGIKLFLLALAGLRAARMIHYAYEIEPAAVQVNPIALLLPRLDPAFDGLRLAHISDIHLNEWMTPERFANVVALVNAQQPDVIALTGDFIQEENSYNPVNLLRVLSELKAGIVTVAVLGNHDHHHDLANVRRAVAGAGIMELANKVHTIRRGDAALHLAGVDDVVHKQARLDLVLPQIQDENAAILLAHEPDFAYVSAATGRFDLQLSGHTHGGQVHFPGVGPLALPNLGQRYPVGLDKSDDMYIYTTRGVGTGRPRVRLNCPPEIALFTLRAKNS